MIENEKQLEYSVESVARMYKLRDKESVESSWDAETRAELTADTQSMITRIEREIGEYLVKKYDLQPKKTDSEQAA